MLEDASLEVEIITDPGPTPTDAAQQDASSPSGQKAMPSSKRTNVTRTFHGVLTQKQTLYGIVAVAIAPAVVTAMWGTTMLLRMPLYDTEPTLQRLLEITAAASALGVLALASIAVSQHSALKRLLRDD